MLATISRLWNALARLAAVVEDLAGTVEETHHGLRAQLGLGHQLAPRPAAIEATTDAGPPPAPLDNGSARASRKGR